MCNRGKPLVAPVGADAGAPTVGEALGLAAPAPQAPPAEFLNFASIFGKASDDSDVDELELGPPLASDATDAALGSQAAPSDNNTQDSYYDSERGDRALDAACYEIFTRLPGRFTSSFIEMIDAQKETAIFI